MLNFISQWSDFAIITKESENTFKVRRIIDNQLYRLVSIPLNDYWGNLIKDKSLHPVIKKIDKIVTASKNNKNIIQYKDSFIDKVSNSFVLITEYVSDTLDSYIIQKHYNLRKFIPEEKLLSIILKIAKGVSGLHGVGIYNINLSPTNTYCLNEEIIVNPYKNITDCVRNCSEYDILPPELINKKSYTKWCDMWYFGLLVYELCCLKKMKRLFIDDLNKMYSAIIYGEYDPIPSFYSKNVKEIIKRCLQYTPDRRITASEIVELIVKIKARKSLDKKIKDFKIRKEREKIKTKPMISLKDLNSSLLKNQNFRKFQKDKYFITEINKMKRCKSHLRCVRERKEKSFDITHNELSIYQTTNENDQNRAKTPIKAIPPLIKKELKNPIRIIQRPQKVEDNKNIVINNYTPDIKSYMQLCGIQMNEILDLKRKQNQLQHCINLQQSIINRLERMERRGKSLSLNCLSDI